jgi:hypothetical protein
MRNWNVSENRITQRSLLAACSAALAVGFIVLLPLPAHAARVTPPSVPQAIKVPAGNRAFLEGHGVGTQNYVCLPCPNPTTKAEQCPDTSGFAWLLFTPEATLFNDHGKQLTTHFFSPNANPDPAEHGIIRATWQDSRDSSIVWGGTAIPSRDRDFVAHDAIAWLLLPMAGVQEGPNGGDTLTATTFIQRVNTAQGLAPSTGCSGLEDVGAKAFVPYTADYVFYTKDTNDN